MENPKCIDQCPAEAITIGYDIAIVNGAIISKDMPVISDLCIACGACTEVCPTEAIALDKYGIYYEVNFWKCIYPDCI